MLYECPKCQSQLKYWEEYVFDKERRINKRTGELNKKVKRSKEIELEQYGISCTECDFVYHGNGYLNTADYGHLDHIYKKIK